MRYHYHFVVCLMCQPLCISECVVCCLKPGIAVFRIRFQIGSFCPFIPCVYENEALVALGEPAQRIADSIFEPLSVLFGGVVQENSRPVFSPGGIVPGGTYTPENHTAGIIVVFTALPEVSPLQYPAGKTI